MFEFKPLTPEDVRRGRENALHKLEELDGVAPCKIVKVDVDENRALALQYAVASIPTLLVFRNGQLVNRSVGLISREDVLKLVQA